jgi:hypothetical protein
VQNTAAVLYEFSYQSSPRIHDTIGRDFFLSLSQYFQILVSICLLETLYP